MSLGGTGSTGPSGVGAAASLTIVGGVAALKGQAIGVAGFPPVPGAPAGTFGTVPCTPVTVNVTVQLTRAVVVGPPVILILPLTRGAAAAAAPLAPPITGGAGARKLTLNFWVQPPPGGFLAGDVIDIWVTATDSWGNTITHCSSYIFTC